MLFIKPCETAIAVSTLAAALAEGKTDCEILMMGSIFTQLGDTLLTIAAQRQCCGNTANKKTVG